MGGINEKKRILKSRGDFSIVEDERGEWREGLVPKWDVIVKWFRSTGLNSQTDCLYVTPEAAKIVIITRRDFASFSGIFFFLYLLNYTILDLYNNL